MLHYAIFIEENSTDKLWVLSNNFLNINKENIITGQTSPVYLVKFEVDLILSKLEKSRFIHVFLSTEDQFI